MKELGRCLSLERRNFHLPLPPVSQENAWVCDEVRMKINDADSVSWERCLEIKENLLEEIGRRLYEETR